MDVIAPAPAHRLLLLVTLAMLTGCNLFLPLGGSVADSGDPADTAGSDADSGDPDGGGPDGATDSSGPDSTTDTAPPLVGCAKLPPGTILCDDFEDPWMVSGYQLYKAGAAALPVRTTEQPTSGTYALETRTTGDGFSAGQFYFTTPVTSGALALRARIRVTGVTDPWVVVLQLSTAAIGTKASVDLNSGFQVDLYCPGSGSRGTFPMALNPDQTYCVELRLSLENKTVSLWVDGNLVDQCDPKSVEFPAAGITRAIFGNSSGGGAASVVLDDVVLATGPVGCN